MVCKKFSKCISSKCCELTKIDSECLQIKKRMADFGEHGKKYRLNMPDDVSAMVYKVDNHIISGNHTMKCDGLVITDGCTKGNKAIFVECKGTDLHRAFEQLSTTVEMLKDIINKNGRYKYYARIVYTGGSQAVYFNEKKKLNDLLRRINGGIKGIFIEARSKRFEESLDNLN